MSQATDNTYQLSIRMKLPNLTFMAEKLNLNPTKLFSSATSCLTQRLAN